MSSLARLILAASKKRKKPEGESDGFNAPPIKTRPDPLKQGHVKQSEPPPPAKNRLLAGYLAHEFLTRGTLLGRPFDPALPELVKPNEPAQNFYADVSYLMKLDGNQLSGIVNPSQLGSWVGSGTRGDT